MMHDGRSDPAPTGHPATSAQASATPATSSPAPPAPPPPRPPQRRRWRARRVLAVVGGLTVAGLLAPAPLVDPIVDRAAYRYEGRCASFSGVDVDSGDWPVVARAAMGRLRRVSMRTDEVRFDNGFALHDIRFSAERIHAAPLPFGLVDQDADIQGGRSSSTVLFDDLEQILAAHGVTAQLRAEGGAMMADVEVPVVGVVTTTVDLAPVDGDLELGYGVLDAIELPPIVLEFPEPLALEHIEVADDGLRVETAVEGTITAQDWGCDTAT